MILSMVKEPIRLVSIIINSFRDRLRNINQIGECYFPFFGCFYITCITSVVVIVECPKNFWMSSIGTPVCLNIVAQYVSNYGTG